MTPVGDGWYRCSISHGSVPTLLYVSICAANGGNGIVTDGSSGVYAWGAQVNRGTTPDTYAKTSGTAISSGVFARARSQGTGAEAFSGTASLHGRAALAAAGTQATGNTGTGAIYARAQITATGAEAFSGTAAIHARASLSGNGDGTSTATGTLTARARLAAAGTLHFAGAGTLTARSSATAAGVQAFSGTAAILAAATVAAAATLEYLGAGTLTARSEVSGMEDLPKLLHRLFRDGATGTPRLLRPTATGKPRLYGD